MSGNSVVNNLLGPTVQIIVSLTSLLRVNLFSVLQLTLIFFVGKKKAFALPELLTFFNKKSWLISGINV